MTKSIIKHITHPYAQELWQSRKDEAHITNQPLVERPWWFEDDRGQTWHDLYACLGWPTEVSDRDVGMPGYAGIVGISRPRELDDETHYNPQDAQFVLLAEAQSRDVPTLLDMCLDLRGKYGFGVQPDLISFWYGDPDRFYTTLALKNERLIREGGDKNTILIAPPDDFYTPAVFDNYVRSITSTMIEGKVRFCFDQGCDILYGRLKEFVRDDPAVLAVGGLIHSLLNRTMWMTQAEGSTIFSVEGEV